MLKESSMTTYEVIFYCDTLLDSSLFLLAVGVVVKVWRKLVEFLDEREELKAKVAFLTQRNDYLERQRLLLEEKASTYERSFERVRLPSEKRSHLTTIPGGKR